MNHCRTSYKASRRGRREQQRPSGASRMIGPLMVLLAAGIWPTAVFAADATVDTQRNAIVVFMVIILLLGSVAAGLFFASPLRRKWLPSTADGSDAAAALSDAQRESRTVIAPREVMEPEPLVARYTPYSEPAPEPPPFAPPTEPVYLPQPTHQPQPPVPPTYQPQLAYQTPPAAQPPQPPAYQPQPQYQPQPAFQQPAAPHPQPQYEPQPSQPQPSQYEPKPSQPQPPIPQPSYQQPLVRQQPPPPPAQPPTGVPQPPSPRSGSAAWSTGIPTPNSNWHPDRR